MSIDEKALLEACKALLAGDWSQSVTEIPAYQAIDILTGALNREVSPPVKGWAITHPVLGAELFETDEAAGARIAQISASAVKWPLQTSKFRAWIHTDNNCKYWTPR